MNPRREAPPVTDFKDKEQEMNEESKRNPRMDALAARVERLERQNRWLTSALLIVAVGAALLVTLAAVAPPSIQDVVKAKSFAVVDDEGNVRAELGFSADGSHGLVLRDADGSERATLAVSTKGSAQGLSLRDPEGKTRALLAVSPDGFAGVRLFGAADAKSFAGITVSPHGTGLGLAYLDAEGKQRVGLSILGVPPDQSPSLELYDADGKTVFSAP